MRKKIAALSKRKASVFKWRSHEPSRLETFSDAVFAFAITLIMVSLEVLRTFNEYCLRPKNIKARQALFICLSRCFIPWCLLTAEGRLVKDLAKLPSRLLIAAATYSRINWRDN
jgi:hypothetical protein